MAEEKQRGNVHATLALSQEEARTGTERLVTLPSGQKVTLYIYPGAYNGQKIHLSGRGEPTMDGTLGDLIVTLMVPTADSLVEYPFDLNASDAEMSTVYLNTSFDLPNGLSSFARKPSRILPSAYAVPDRFSVNSQYQAPMASIRSSKLQLSDFIPSALVAIFSQRQPFASGQRSPLLIAFTLLLVLVLLLGGGLVLYTTVYVPYKASSDATATAIAQATQVAQANATAFARQAATASAIEHATAIALTQLQNDYTVTTSSTPYLSDSLQTPYVADWDVNSNCKFFGGAYHVTSSMQKTIALCLAINTHFSNFAFQVHMNTLKGDGGGIVFRADANSSQNYLLKISSNGEFELDYYPDQTGTTAQALASDSSKSLKTGYNQDNIICVIARGDTISLYFNGQYVTTVKDSNLTSGQVGLTADDGTNATEVAYTQAQVWRL